MLSNYSCKEVEAGLPACAKKADTKRVREMCEVMTHHNGLFAACHAVVNPDMFTGGCYIDMCSDPQNIDLYCAVLEAYAEACQEWRVYISWRSSQTCRKCAVDDDCIGW